MKKFLLYVLLPGVVLGIVYQSGRNSGMSSMADRLERLESSMSASAPAEPTKVVKSKSSSSSAVKTPADPAKVVKSNSTSSGKVSSGSGQTVKVDPSQVPKPNMKPRSTPKLVLEPVDDFNIPAGTRVDTNRIPTDESVDRFVQITPEEFVSRHVTKSPKEVPVVGVSRMIEKKNSLGQTVYEYDAPPATYVPTPIPTVSIYENLSKGATTKTSDLGVVPLAPLQPSAPATVYPKVQDKRTTFKEPVLAPTLPIETAPAVQSSTRIVSPIRITSSAECDCGKSH